MGDSTSCQCQVEDRKIPALLIDNICRSLFRPPAKFLSRFVSAGATVADLGCGPGYFTLPMAKLVGGRGRVYAIDFDPKAVERVTRKTRQRGFSGSVEAHAVSASEIDFIASGSVDFVLAEGLLCCMKDHAGAIGQIRRILKEDGCAYVSVIKFARRGDPRGVGKEEWDGILGGMRVLESGENLVSRWALLAPNASNGGRDALLERSTLRA